MSRIPAITAKTIIRFLQSQGFEQARQKGSHRFFRHPDGRTATVPDHAGETLGKGIMTRILKDAELSIDIFLHWHTGRKT
ncbi:MAG: type II toxin-antitoxin system HicA family toxin [bacterium]|nr:type II toxin-antitoxin system HicA family toxin [bacterium]